jgi:hypothetical protein
MKTVVTTFVAVSLVVFLSTIVTLKLSSKAHASPTSPGSAAVVIECTRSEEGFGTNITVALASSSSNAPIITIGANCAQVLADLLSSGFEITNALPLSVNAEGMTYTLINQPGKHGKDK